MLLAEALVDNAIATLQAALPAALAEVNAAGGVDPISVPGPEDYYLGMQHEIPVYPAIEVAAASERVLNFDITLRGADDAIPIYVVAWAESANHPQLARHVYRLSDACTRALITPHAFGGDAVVVQLDVTYVGQQPENRDPPIMRGAAIMAFQLVGVATAG